MICDQGLLGQFLRAEVARSELGVVQWAVEGLVVEKVCLGWIFLFLLAEVAAEGKVFLFFDAQLLVRLLVLNSEIAPAILVIRALYAIEWANLSFMHF